MIVFQADCPHLGTKSVAFIIVCEWQAGKISSYHWDTLAHCRQRNQGVLTTFDTPDPNRPTINLNDASWDYSRDNT